MISMFFLMISMFLLKNACTIFPQKTLPLQSFFCENRPSNDYPTADAERPLTLKVPTCRDRLIYNSETKSVGQQCGPIAPMSRGAPGQQIGHSAKRSKYNQLNKQKQL